MKLHPALLVLAVLFALTGAVYAGPPESFPATPALPPRPPTTTTVAGLTDPLAAPQLAVALPPLKAVLIVGPIDGDNGPWTNDERANMELAASELEANGVAVARFYTPNNNWEQIKAAANGAQFLFYRGHGVYLSAMPTPKVGGFSLKDGIITPQQIRSDLHLAPQAIVMLYGCFTAGSASNDVGSITSQEAQRRVAEYAAPFFEAGAGGYFADWFGDAFQMYVRALFAGKTLGQAYEAYADFGAATVERYSYPSRTNLALWLDKDVWSGVTQYNNAFIGLADKTLAQLFTAPGLSLTQNNLSVLTTPVSGALHRAVTVSGADGTAQSWTATVTPANLAWLQVASLLNGTSQQLALSLDPTGLAPGTYSATVTVHLNGAATTSADQTLTVDMRLVQTMFSTYLPLTVR